MNRLAVLISGRGSNMSALAQACESGILKGLATIEVVIANKCDAAGLHAADEMGIPSHCVESKGRTREEFEKELKTVLENYHPDYIILAGFMRRLTADFTGSYPDRIINIHPADTRQHRGLGAYRWAWEKKLPETKITVHYVNEKIDDGEIIAQANVDLTGATSLEEVEQRGLAVEHQFFAQALKTVFEKNQQLCVE